MKAFNGNIFITSILFFICVACYSQKNITDTVHQLSPVSVTAERLNVCSIGYKMDTLDSLTLIEARTLTVAELLTTYTSVYIKSYGLDNIVSIMFRGTAAEHTGIFWNGIEVNTPNLGTYDVSLIPASFFNTVEIKHGGSASLYGSGNIGGSIFFSNEPIFTKQLSASIDQSLGSFGTYITNGLFNIANNNVFSKTCFFRKSAANDFPYTDYALSAFPRERMQNDQVMQYGIMNDTYIRLSKEQLLGISLYYENSDRNIPATLVSGISKTYQVDKAERALLNWKINAPAVSLKIKAAYLNDYYDYVDSIANINSLYKTKTFITEAEANKTFGNNQIYFGVTGKEDIANIAAYNSEKTQYSGAAFLSYIHRFSFGWSVNVNMRQEAIEGYNAPFSPSLGIEGKLIKNFTFSGSVSKNFRAPTFNELYYQPGGNLQLKPETSWNEEAGLTYLLKKNAFHFELTASAYSSMINDFILWVPVSEDVSEAENVLKVWCRGVESAAKASFAKGNFLFTLNASYTYAHSTYENEVTPGDNSLHKQLIYVPMNDVCGTFNITYKRKYYLSYNQTFTGKRFTNEDNMNFLPDYTIGNINAGAMIKINKLKANIQFSLLNIWSERYYPIEWMPMPEINYMVTIGVGI
jgi:iron complex outermembrane receptor protein